MRLPHDVRSHLHPRRGCGRWLHFHGKPLMSLPFAILMILLISILTWVCWPPDDDNHA
jgi:ABC-type methionine transport system permease subunit